MEQDIKLILEWQESLPKLDNYLLKEYERLQSLKRNEIENSSLSLEAKMLKYSEIEELQDKCILFMDFTSFINNFITKNLEMIKDIEQQYDFIDFLISKEAYRSIFHTRDDIKIILKEIRFLSLPIQQLLKSKEDYEKLRQRVTDFECYLKQLSNRVNKIRKSFFENVFFNGQVVVQDKMFKAIYETDGNHMCYKNLDDILLEAISYGYPYSFYYHLALESLSKQRFLCEIKCRGITEDVELQKNDVYVVQRNANNEEILALYPDELLCDVRKELLHEMSERTSGFAKDERDSEKVATIGRVLARREESL